jgi:methylenetetrahydrofolate dehydrogenase (NADP+) / methenyltetrahydrofolate cyclohydrolase
MILLDGKQTSLDLQNEIAEEVKALTAKGQRPPHLAAILVGNDGASETYVGSKVKTCERVGFASTLIRFDSNVTEEELLARIEEVNADDSIDGLIVQLPLPKHISVDRVTETIAPHKDVDGFHIANVGRMAKGMPAYISATPYGILKLIERYKIDTVGKDVVVLGRSQIVGSPMSILMARNEYPGNSTVTLCHSKTRDLEGHLKRADIIIVALGKPGFVTGDMVKEGAVVIDVGITRVEDASKKSGFALKGDVDFESVAPKCSYITPVPGGVGPMTIAALLQNTLLSAKKEIYTR